MTGRRASEARAEVTCPVVGEGITLEEPVNGKRTVMVDDGDEHFRLVLKKGRYVRSGE